MNRYWVSWWSGNYASEGCTKPPFQTWVSAYRSRTLGDEQSLCAVIDAPSKEAIWEVVKRHFPDYEPRFCEQRAADYIPGDRFPGFEGRTSLSIN